MKSVGLKVLKNKLSEYVRLAAAGETIVVTDRNRIVAEIVPPRPHDKESFLERVREGWLSPQTDLLNRCHRVSPCRDSHLSNCWPISTAIEKTAGDLCQQFGSARGLVRRAPISTGYGLGRGSGFKRAADL
jgi:prevent-host-death family protein